MSAKKPDRYVARHVWYLGEAQTLVRELQAVMWPVKWHVAMGGGVLNHGYSNDDLDLYILPLNKDARVQDAEAALLSVLEFSRSISSSNGYKNMAPAIETADIYTHHGKRVDVFVFKPHCTVCGVAERLLGDSA